MEDDFINVNTGRWQKSGMLADGSSPTAPHTAKVYPKVGGNLQASPELRQCADAHEDEVMIKDSYDIRELSETHPDIKYIVDIGGNIGCFGIQVARYFPQAKIITCEPEPELMKYNRLNTNNKLIYVEKAIVGDPELKEVTFNVCKWQGNHHIDGKFDMESWKRYGCEVLEKVTVPAVTLAQVVKENKFPRIDLLKVDTEGSEPDILEGIKPWLKNIKYIVGEWHSQADLARVKKALEETHECTFTQGEFFKEESGLSANGNIYATLKV